MKYLDYFLLIGNAFFFVLMLILGEWYNYLIAILNLYSFYSVLSLLRNNPPRASND